MATEVNAEPAATAAAASMDIDDIKELKGKLIVAFLNPQTSSTHGSLGLTTVPTVNFTTMTLGELQDLIVQDNKCPSTNTDGLDILHKAKLITGKTTSTLQHLDLKPNSIIQVVKRFSKTKTTGKKHDAMDADGTDAGAIGGAVAKDRTYSNEQLHQVSLALRTGFMQPAFAKTIKRLGESEMLDSIIAIAPQLATDTVGLAIIQSPGMIYYYSELEPMKKLAEERPWVIDAFNFIAAAVHQDKSAGTSFPRELVSSLLEGDGDEDMDDDQGPPRSGNTSRPTSAPQASRSQPNLFTRERVEQAIRAAFPFSIPPPAGGSTAGSSGSGGGAGATNLSELYRSFQQAVSPNAGTSATPFGTPASPNPVQSPAPTTAAQPLTPGAISTTDFARAIMEAVNHLPESVRNEQMNLLRDRIQQISGTSGGGAVQAQSTQPTTSAAPPTGSETQSAEYRAELNQMREIGITNERLALQALRVCEGDVSTACDLILGGWNGEGAEEEPR